MDFPDINILIAAFRPDVEHHAEIKDWLETSLISKHPIRLFPLVEAGFLRIVTHSKIFDPPSSLTEAGAFLDVMSAAPSVETVRWTPETRARWLRLCQQLQLLGNDCNDAMLAAVAMESGLRLVSFDEGFSRFPGLRRWNPRVEAR